MHIHEAQVMVSTKKLNRLEKNKQITAITYIILEKYKYVYK